MVTEAEAEVLATVLKHMRSKNDVEKTTSKKLWLVRRLKMDGFNASLCQTSWATSLGCPAGESLSLSLSDLLHTHIQGCNFSDFLYYTSVWIEVSSLSS